MVRAREEAARLVQEGASEGEDDLVAARAENTAAGRTLLRDLKTLDRSRSRITGDKPTPRKRAAGSSRAASSGGQEVLEMQSMRRAGLALVECAKLVSAACFFLAPRMLTARAVPALAGHRHQQCRRHPRPRRPPLWG